MGRQLDVGLAGTAGVAQPLRDGVTPVAEHFRGAGQIQKRGRERAGQVKDQLAEENVACQQRPPLCPGAETCGQREPQILRQQLLDFLSTSRQATRWECVPGSFAGHQLRDVVAALLEQGSSLGPDQHIPLVLPHQSLESLCFSVGESLTLALQV